MHCLTVRLLTGNLTRVDLSVIGEVVVRLRDQPVLPAAHPREGAP